MSDFERGKQDALGGFMAFDPGNESYMFGYDCGVQQLQDEADAYYYDDYDPWNPIEQGMYDDDPSPYFGDYSEM